MSTDASWPQAANLLTLVSNRGTSSEQVQKLYSSGLLADLLDANVDKVNREEFRKLLGLGPIFSTDKRGRFLITVTGLGLTGEEWLARLDAAGFKPTKWARDILTRPDYNEKHRLEPGKQYTVALMFGKKEFSTDAERTTANLRARGERDYGKSDDLRGELDLLIREAISDEQLERWEIYYIAVLHEPIVDSDGSPSILALDRDGGGRQVDAFWDFPGSYWSALEPSRSPSRNKHSGLRLLRPLWSWILSPLTPPFTHVVSERGFYFLNFSSFDIIK